MNLSLVVGNRILAIIYLRSATLDQIPNKTPPAPMPAAHQTRFQMPGFGLPLNWVPDYSMQDLFPNALNELHMESGSTR